MSQGSELPLFDLPLHANDETEETDAEDEAGATIGGDAVGGDAVGGDMIIDRADEPDGEAMDGEAMDGETADRASEKPAPPRDRLVGGLLDLGIQMLVLGATVAAVTVMGISVSSADWMPFTLLGLVFSFLYWFIPLAFWGQTPGMAWVGQTALSLDGEPLSFGQTVLRWLGSLVTLALLGLPLLLALGGRSLTDRLSESKTVLV